VFGLLIVLLAVVGPLLHTKVAVGTPDVACKLRLVLTQFSTVSTPALILGAAMSCVTTTASLAVQPLLGFVAVTVYVFGVVTVLLPVVGPLLHTKVAVGNPEVACKLKLVRTQFSKVSSPAFTVGGVIF
jgi:hypothetical protein